MTSETSLANGLPALSRKLTKVGKRLNSVSSGRSVPHWGVDDVIALVEAARCNGRGVKAERDALLIATIFDPALSVSEALTIRPIDVVRTIGGYRIGVDCKTGPRSVAVSPSLVAQMKSYAYEVKLDPYARFFPINRHRTWQIVNGAANRAGLTKPRGVGTVHILRHSGAIERMRLSGNPRSVQHQLGHSTPAMTLRYFQTLAVEEALEVQEQVDFGW